MSWLSPFGPVFLGCWGVTDEIPPMLSVSDFMPCILPDLPVMQEPPDDPPSSASCGTPPGTHALAPLVVWEIPVPQHRSHYHVNLLCCHQFPYKTIDGNGVSLLKRGVGGTRALAHSIDYPFCQWEFQDPKMEVLYNIRPYFVGISPYIGLT